MLMHPEPVHTCPLCGRTGGEPFRAVPLDDKNVRLLIRCDGCRHRWSAIVVTESLSPEARSRLTRHSDVGLPGSVRR
jgi:hypothetical protein